MNIGRRIEKSRLYTCCGDVREIVDNVQCRYKYCTRSIHTPFADLYLHCGDLHVDIAI